MSVSIKCPNPECGKTSAGSVELVGRNVRCKHCGRQFVAGATVSLDETRRTESTPADPFPVLPAKFGRYRVVKLLGKGGMGSVYLAEDLQLHRRVALKLPAFTAGESALKAERFVREAQSAAVLQHPNICTVYDAGQVGDRPYITMAFIEGRPLDDRIDPDKPMPPEEAARIARQVALALQEAHDRKIVHRDLKPANVMMNSRGEPIVMDFGLAKKVNETEADAEVGPAMNPADGDAKLTRDGTVLGTPSYMAPEQVRGEMDKIGPRTDVYALGVMLFEMLTGRTPYSGPLGVVMGRIIAAPVPSVSEFRPDVDPRLDAACRKAMAKEPGARFGSMTAFAAALDLAATVTQTADPFAALASGDPSPAKRRGADTATRTAVMGRKPDPATPGLRRPLLIGGAGLVAAAVLVVTLLLAFRPREGEIAIELSDPKAKVVVSVDGKPVEASSLGKPMRLKAGEHTLTVSGDGFEAETQAFTVKRGTNDAVRVALRRKESTARPPDVSKLTKLFDHDFRDPSVKLDGKAVPRKDGHYLLQHEGANQWSIGSPALGRVTADFVARVVVRLVAPFEGELHWTFVGDDGRQTQFKLASDLVYVQDTAGKGWPEERYRGAGIRSVGESNELVVAVRGRRVEYFLNGRLAANVDAMAQPVGPGSMVLNTWRHGQTDTPPSVLVESATAWAIPDARTDSPDFAQVLKAAGLPEEKKLSKLFGYDFRDPSVKIDGKDVTRKEGMYLLEHTGSNPWGDGEPMIGRVSADFVYRIKVQLPPTPSGTLHLGFNEGNRWTHLKHSTGQVFLHQGLVPNVTGHLHSSKGLRPPGQVNELVLVARGRRGEVFINGESAGPAFEVPEPIGSAQAFLGTWRSNESEPRPAFLIESVEAWAIPDMKPVDADFGPMVFDDTLTTPEALDKLHRFDGQRGGKPTVVPGEGLRLNTVHTNPAVWVKPSVGDRYRMRVDVRLEGTTKEGVFSLSGAGYGPSPGTGYAAVLSRDTVRIEREGAEVWKSPLPKPVGEGQWIAVQADVDKGRIDLTVNGFRVGSYTDASPLTGALHGWVGLNGSHEFNSRVLFRNLKVWSAAKGDAERQLLPPARGTVPAKNGELLHEFKPTAAKPLADWWQSQPTNVGLEKDGVVLGLRPNTTPDLVLTKPLPGAVACEIEFEHTTTAALNLQVGLWHSKQPPKVATDCDGGWHTMLPGGSNNLIFLQTASGEGDPKRLGVLTPIVARTAYFTPVTGRRYTARLELRGDELRVFLDGRFLMSARRPKDKPAPDTPVFLSLAQFYHQTKVYAVRVHKLSPGK